MLTRGEFCRCGITIMEIMLQMGRNKSLVIFFLFGRADGIERLAFHLNLANMGAHKSNYTPKAPAFLLFAECIVVATLCSSKQRR